MSSAAPSGVPFPIARQHNYRIEQAELALELDPTDGGRIVEFSLRDAGAGAGQNVLLTRVESARAYGSSFWPSPQSDWKWPPPAELDALPWTTQIEGNVLVATTARNQKLGLSAEQRIELLPAARAAAIEFRLVNHGSAPLKVAGWQNSRLRPGGLSFFPSAGPAAPGSKFPLEPSGGVSWFLHGGKADTRTGKLFADAEEGWLAHVDRDLLFVKVFPPVPAARQAPGEGEVEIYVDPEGQFVEVEQQGPYEEVAPGGTLSWKVHWLLERLPPGSAVEPGSSALLERARALAARVR